MIIEKNKGVKLSTIVEECGLEIVHKSSNYENIILESPDVNRPGLQLTGYFEEFPYKRLQIIGNVEFTYLMDLDDRMQYERYRGLISYNIPAVIFSYGRDIPNDILELTDYYDKTLLRSDMPTTLLISTLSQHLEHAFAQRTNIHGELLEVYGIGVLISGESSIGKSETALDLVTRGHRLVADDVVELTAYDGRLIGKSPENIRHYMEIRGLGIIDVRRLYGSGAVKTVTDVDLVIHLENWRNDYEYDRLGLDDHYTDILGIRVPKILVPVRAGRNLAMIIEVACMNQREKSLGYNAAQVMTNNIFGDKHIDRNLI